MRTFLQLRELAGRKPEGNGFVAYIDGDRLDVYRTQREAEKAISEFMKQYK